LNFAAPPLETDAASRNPDDSDRQCQLRSADWFKNDDLFAVCLVVGMPPAGAARAAGISRATAYRRMKDPALERQVTELRLQIRSNLVGSFMDGMRNAVRTLCHLLESKSEQIQLAAAQQLLKHGYVNALQRGDPLFNDLDPGRVRRMAEFLASLPAEEGTTDAESEQDRSVSA
jgi:hypothetical protein